MAPSLENVDPEIFPLVDALNRTGVARTRASCQGHRDQWTGISAPYISFTTTSEVFAEAFDWWLQDAFKCGQLRQYWEMHAWFGSDRQLWFRLSPPFDHPGFQSALPWRKRAWWERYREEIRRDIQVMVEWLQLRQNTLQI